MLSSYRGNSDAPAGATSGKAILVSVDGLTAPAPVLIVTADSPYSIPADLSSGQMYMLDTASGALTMTLPAAPSDGQQIIFKRISTDGNTVTIARNGKLIEGAASDYTNSSTALAAFVFEYSADNGSWWLVGQALAPASSVAVGNITGLGTGVATWLATPSSANLAACVTGETGSGSLVFANLPVFNTTIGVGGATASNSGSGVTFPATQSASTNANTLDDYEKGTWTPTDASGAGLAFTGVTGHYRKIGALFVAAMAVNYPATADTTQSAIGGLPFTTYNPGGNWTNGCNSGTIGYSNAGTPPAQLHVAAGAATYQMFQANAGSVRNVDLSSTVQRHQITAFTS